jgi:ATP-dependent RNA helicase SUPV3L1/SUV3
LILSKALVDLSDTIKAFQSLNMTTDLKKPHEWYPLTRIMKRKIIFHGGPTNSGKTYHALQRLKEADVSRGGGLYCGPLRLLALEVYELLNRQGISTSLVTGQEKKEIPGSTHVSSTLEMVSMTREYDVAVIDEIQMIADKDRGYAWTRALLGLRAREVHLCGGLEAEQLVRSLVASSGDEFVLQKYDRLSRLHIEEQSLRGDYTQVQAGDCIVAFSKSDIFSIRRQVGDT